MAKADASLTKTMRAGGTGSADQSAEPTSTLLSASNLPTPWNRPIPVS